MAQSTKTNKELHALSREKLVTELGSAQNELFSIRMKQKQGELKETHLVRMWKRYIARIKTFIAQTK